jgi:phosphoesterase RecJ-like protein
MTKDEGQIVMSLDWSPFVALVRRHKRFVLTTHVRPDADGLGSLQALAEALEAMGKLVERVVPSPVPPRYDFLDPDRRIKVFAAPGESLRSCDALIVLDTGTWNQLADVGPFVRVFAGEKAVIDHHGTQDDLGATRFVNVKVEATGRLAFDAIRALDVSLSPAMATNLFAALAWDTGWYRHAQTTPWTLALAGELVAAGAKPTLIHELLYERNSLAGLKLRGLFLERLEIRAGGRIAYSHIRFADYAATGATPYDAEDFVDYPRSIEGVEVALRFIERRDGDVKVSFRSRRLDVARLAERFGGGGHKLAAGATVAGPFDAARDRVLQAVESAVNES